MPRVANSPAISLTVHRNRNFHHFIDRHRRQGSCTKGNTTIAYLPLSTMKFTAALLALTATAVVGFAPSARVVSRPATSLE
jgi:long-subunit acyl-CoA synthetase (AMP-forming)